MKADSNWHPSSILTRRYDNLRKGPLIRTFLTLWNDHQADCKLFMSLLEALSILLERIQIYLVYSLAQQFDGT